MALKSINSKGADYWKGKRVLIRADFNVPLNKEDTSKIDDTTRIDLTLPTIKYLLQNGVEKITLMSHLGRPKGEFKPEFSLAPVATYLADNLDEDVILTEKAIDCGVKELLTLKSTKIVLLENLRFHPEETKNDDDFAQKLAQYADVYICDAFGAVHRQHASVYQINKYFHERFAGLLLTREIEALNTVLETPKKPFVAIMGGAKVSDKIKTIEKLLVSVDSLLIGGAMAYPFLKAQGQEIGDSICSDEDQELAAKLLKSPSAGKIKLPIDHQVAPLKEMTKASTTEGKTIASGLAGFDIGPQTEKSYSKIINSAQTVFWNGPMGFFEKEPFDAGSLAISKAMSTCAGFTMVGGGDSVSAVNKSGLADKMNHISTGGGATLEFIEKGQLPGVQALRFGIS